MKPRDWPGKEPNVRSPSYCRLFAAGCCGKPPLTRNVNHLKNHSDIEKERYIDTSMRLHTHNCLTQSTVSLCARDGAWSHCVHPHTTGAPLDRQMPCHGIYKHIYIFTFTFSRHFYSKRLTNEDNGSNQNQQKSNDMQVL